MTNASKQVSPVKKTIDIKKKKKDIQIQEKKKLEERKYKRKIGMFFFVTMILIYCLMFIYISSQLNTTKKRMTEIKRNYETLKSLNDSIDYEISGYIDSSNIIELAINELGMCYPDIKNQIIYYKSNVPEYMNQYKNIPK